MSGTKRAIGWGLAAGVAGTAAMTLSQRLEQSFTHREGSTVPAQVGAKVMGSAPATEEGALQMGWAVHWSHGVTMGLVRGLLGLTPMSAGAASAVHFGALWGGDALLYRALGIDEMPWKWEKEGLVTDLGHKLVLSAVTSAVFVSRY
jgi:hypothetical protein